MPVFPVEGILLQHLLPRSRHPPALRGRRPPARRGQQPERAQRGAAPHGDPQPPALSQRPGHGAAASAAPVPPAAALRPPPAPRRSVPLPNERERRTLRMSFYWDKVTWEKRVVFGSYKPARTDLGSRRTLAKRVQHSSEPSVNSKYKAVPMRESPKNNNNARWKWHRASEHRSGTAHPLQPGHGHPAAPARLHPSGSACGHPGASRPTWAHLACPQSPTSAPECSLLPSSHWSLQP